jgi:hypothetical protein
MKMRFYNSNHIAKFYKVLEGREGREGRKGRKGRKGRDGKDGKGRKDGTEGKEGKEGKGQTKEGPNKGRAKQREEQKQGTKVSKQKQESKGTNKQNTTPKQNPMLFWRIWFLNGLLFSQGLAWTTGTFSRMPSMSSDFLDMACGSMEVHLKIYVLEREP